jgi:hypothetical protein
MRVSVPDKFTFNLTRAKTVCYLIVHVHNLSVSVTSDVICFAEKDQADCMSDRQ